MLNDTQIGLIESDIKASGVYMQTLSYDILDHICCSVEEKMSAGSNFEIAYERTKHEFSPNGFDEIQSETVTLLTLNSKKMKTFRSILGISAAGIFITGTLMGKFHMKGSGILIVLGSFFMTIFLLTQLKTKYLEEPTKQVKIVQTLAVITSVLLMIGLCFYIMHWPGAKILFGGGLLLLTLGIAPLVVKNFQAITAQLTGQKVATGIVFIGITMFAFANTGNSKSFYDSLSAADEMTSLKLSNLNESNKILRQKSDNKLVNHSNDICSYIADLKENYLKSLEYKEVYKSDIKDVKYLLKNGLWSTGFQEVSNVTRKEYSLTKLYQQVKLFEEALKENNINHDNIIHEDKPEWISKYFEHKPLFGMFLYLDQLQVEIRRIEREVLLYNL